MISDPSLIADLVRAGVDPDLISRVSNAIVSASVCGMSADSYIDESAERRRFADRERKRQARLSAESPRNSAESAECPNRPILLIEDISKKDKKEATEENVRRRPRTSKVPLPDDWQPASPISAAATAELAKMRDWAKSNAISKADWEATFRNWLRRAGIDPQPPPPTEVAPTGHYAAFTSEEREAWDAYGRKTRGMNYPRDKAGGWYFPTRWPPGHEEMALDEYQSRDDFAKSITAAYDAIKERKAAGGPGWEPK